MRVNLHCVSSIWPLCFQHLANRNPLVTSFLHKLLCWHYVALYSENHPHQQLIHINTISIFKSNFTIVLTFLSEEMISIIIEMRVEKSPLCQPNVTSMLLTICNLLSFGDKLSAKIVVLALCCVVLRESPSSTAHLHQHNFSIQKQLYCCFTFLSWGNGLNNNRNARGEISIVSAQCDFYAPNI